MALFARGFLPLNHKEKAATIALCSFSEGGLPQNHRF